MGRHVIHGYYAYPAALLSIAAGMFSSGVITWVESNWAQGRPTLGRCLPGLVAGLLALALLPGSGARTLVAHARHRDDPAYDVRAFSRMIMNDLPPDARVAVDPSLVIEFYLAGQPVVPAIIDPTCYDVRRDPFEYAVFAQRSLKETRPWIHGLVLVRTYGDRNDPFAFYAELYRRESRPSPRGPDFGGCDWLEDLCLQTSRFPNRASGL